MTKGNTNYHIYTNMTKGNTNYTGNTKKVIPTITYILI